MNIGNITPSSGTVTLNGWVHDLRDLGGVKFLLLRDSTGIIQVTIVTKNMSPEISEIIKHLTPESVISVNGSVQANEKVKSGLEVIPATITLHSLAKPELPISVTEKAITTGLAKRLDWRCLDLRKLKHQAIFRVQSALLEGMSTYLLNDGFCQVFTPCILGVASESGSEVFPLIYFDREAFLRQDPQLHRQLTIAGGMPKLFDIGPAWRAELSHTNKHLCEHRVCAVESAFINDEFDTMSLEEQVIIAALTNVKKKCAKDLELLGVELTIPTAPFPVLSFPEIYEIVRKRGKKIEYGDDLDSEADKLIWEYVQQELKSEFYFINRFPSRIKPFYVMRNDADPQWARSVDLNFKGLELSSGGQREHRFPQLMENVKRKGMKETEVQWFTQFFEYGVPPHGGFAIGIERLTMSLLAIENVRDCVLFPRDPERLVP
ncbi:aspartate--tRNA(Asn) ligase [Candidatus Woesearchaeota archaeon]|nr:aspartate--tRNA(Asn) ligase [Candidatus Woesearchaeota archaeon]